MHSVFINEHGISTIDWKDHKACIELNKAILQEYYKIEYWSIPDGFLCPTITSRVNYLNWIDELLKVDYVKSNILSYSRNFHLHQAL